MLRGRNQRNSWEEKERKQNPAKLPIPKAVCWEKEALPGQISEIFFFFFLGSASAWLVFSTAGLIGHGAQGGAESEAPFRPAEARVQPVQGGMGAGEQGLCVSGHRAGEHMLPGSSPHWMQLEIRGVAGGTWVWAAPGLCDLGAREFPR